MKTVLGTIALILLLSSCAGGSGTTTAEPTAVAAELFEETDDLLADATVDASGVASEPTPTPEATPVPEPTPESLDLAKSVAALESFEQDYADAITTGGLAFYAFAAEHSWPRGEWTAADIRCNYELNLDVYDGGDASYAYRNFALIESTEDWSPSTASGQPGAGQVPGEGTFLVSVDYLDSENRTAHVHIDKDYHVSLFPKQGCVDSTLTEAEALELINHSPFDSAIAVDGHLMMFNLNDPSRFALALDSGRVIVSEGNNGTVAQCTDESFKYVEGVRDPCDEIPERELENQLLAVSKEVGDLQACLDVRLCSILEGWQPPFSFGDVDDVPEPGSDSDDGWEFLTALSARVIEEDTDMDPEIGTLSSGLHSDGTLRFTLALNGPDNLIETSEISFLRGFMPSMTAITGPAASLSITVERVQVTGSRTGTVYVCTMDEITRRDWSACLPDPDRSSSALGQSDRDELYYSVIELTFPGTSRRGADTLRTQICDLVRIAGLEPAIAQMLRNQESNVSAENVELVMNAGVLSECPEEIE